MGQNPCILIFPKGIKMLKVKNIKSEKIDTDKNKLNTIKPVTKNSISTKLNQKKEFHRSLEAFSDCV